MREARLELAYLTASEPKSGASTNFATPALNLIKAKFHMFEYQNYFFMLYYT